MKMDAIEVDLHRHVFIVGWSLLVVGGNFVGES